MRELQDGLIKINWDAEPVEYKHFTDIGHYMIEMKDFSIDNLKEGLACSASINDWYGSNCCSGTVKKNDRNEVIMSHSMDMEVSLRPGFLTRIKDGKYDTLLLTYIGSADRYKYNPEELAALDADETYLKSIPFYATDAMNETGLYISLDMRCGDSEGGMDCPGTNPGKVRACALSSAALVALNCGTVREAIEFLNDSYDWYTMSFQYETGLVLSWNMAFLIGDATGEYGLVEFGRNGVYFTPYQTFQSNYYIHPILSERAVINHGHGRASTLLDGLMDVQTEQEILENQKKARYHFMMEEPSWKYYSDVESLANVNERRTLSPEEQAARFDAEIIHAGGIDDNLEKLAAYYAGDESGLRGDETIWMGSITSGVNCATKHAIIQMWEKEDTTIEIQW